MKYSLAFAFLLIAVSGTLAQTASRLGIPYDSLQSVLEEMYDLDQEVRIDFMERTQRGDTSLSTVKAKMRKVDSANQVGVKKILAEYGWLPQSKIGGKAAGTLFLVIQHADLETIRKYLPLLKSAVEAGEANATSAAMMEDRVLMYEGKKQLYGSQASGRPKEDGSSEYFIWPIENPEEVNQRRAKVGFNSTVEENAARMNAIYNPNEELPQ
ncbi:MAG: DUF6624 domain-containing protein [Bacteroidota bacterium]